MKTFVAIIAGLLSAYLALAWTVGHLDAVSSTACSAEFTLPAIVCRIGAFGFTLLFTPLAGIAGFFAARSAFAKS